VHDGAVLGCAGFLVYWPGRVGTWCLIGADFPRRAWPWLHKQVARRMAQMQASGTRRIEAETRQGFANADRWMKALGFTPEGAMPAYGHDGATYLRWSRVAPSMSAEAPHG
jgi:hypothetical protein